MTGLRLLGMTRMFGGVACAAALLGATSPGVQREILQRRGHVIDVLPHTGPGLAPDETEEQMRKGVNPDDGRITWEQMTVPPGIYLRAISMGSAEVGFAAGELGKVVRTTDGGQTWQYVLNQGFPYYYYGCHAIDEQHVIISGFQNQSGEGIIRWTDDGGDTWGPVIALPCPAAIKWLAHVQFIDENNGVVEAAWAGGVHRTTNGGQTAGDWTFAQPSTAWFNGTFTFLPDLRLWLAGIDVVYSPNGGLNWSNLPNASPIFDGPIAIHESNHGFIGGGTISPSVQGWVYGTDDGGASWTPSPILTTAYPVRALMLLDEQRGWAAGGNIYSTIGGIWGTTDGGTTWQLELDTGNEMNDLDWVRVDSQYVDVYVAGYISQIWRARIEYPAALTGDVNGDGAVDVLDLLLVLSAWGPCPGCPEDINGDGSVDVLDLLELLANWS